MPVVVLRHESKALASNPLGDPHVRDLHVVVPEGHDPSVPTPVLWYLSGFGSTGRALLVHDGWEEGLEERLARLRSSGQIGPLLVALPDCFTRFGGSQYLSSSAHGDYETYLLQELRTALAQRFAVSRHAIAGRSSGGFGAITQAMRHPELFSAVACHAGDMGFRLAYMADLPQLMNAIREQGSLEKFMVAFERAKRKKDGRWIGPVSVLAMAHAYSPNPAAPLGVDLPFDLEAGTIDERVFARWLAWDPVVQLERAAHQAALRQMNLVYLDCGTRDEYHLLWGARAFARGLREAGIRHDYQEFEDGHRGTNYRFDVSFPLIWQALNAP